MEFPELGVTCFLLATLSTHRNTTRSFRRLGLYPILIPRAGLCWFYSLEGYI
jgi:hypothetical protein